MSTRTESTDTPVPDLARSVRGLPFIVTVACALVVLASLYHLGGAVRGEPLFGNAPDVPLSIEPDEVSLDTLPGSAADHGVTEVTAVTEVVDGGGAFRFWAVVEAATAAGIAVVLWLLRGILLSVRHGDPFVAANVRRLRAIGLVLVIVPPVLAVLTGMARDLLGARSDLADLSNAWFEVTFVPSFIGLGILALAEVWRVGIAMRDELDLTV